MTTILVPLDGSSLAEEILPYAQDLARKLGAKVHFIEVFESSLQAVGARAAETSGMLLHTTEIETERLRKTAEDYLESLTSQWRARDIDTDWEVIEGRPGTKIVECARAHEVDFIAMCTHGRSGLAQLLFGSVANEVLREAGRPVLLVRPKNK